MAAAIAIAIAISSLAAAVHLIEMPNFTPDNIYIALKVWLCFLIFYAELYLVHVLQAHTKYLNMLEYNGTLASLDSQKHSSWLSVLC